MTTGTAANHVTPVEVDPGAALSQLLTTVPCDAQVAACAFASAGARLLGSPVTVSVCVEGAWVRLAGPTPAAGTAGREGTHASCVVAGGATQVQWSPSAPVPAVTRVLLEQAAAWLSLVLEADSSRSGAAAETAALREVSSRLLAVRDVDQVLLTVVEQTLQLLDADICGVMLLEGDVVRMRACVGNRAAETARLTMRRGQGVAGLVFQTGRPSKVDRYAEDTTISDDFVSLAAREATQSALAVPLRLQGEFVGVLEVWRRRASVFTDRDVQRMVTLADFATIAIDNARLHDEHAAAAERSTAARVALQAQVAALDRASRLQQDLLRTVVEGGGLPAIARAVSEELGCEVGVYGPDGERVTVHRDPGRTAVLPEVVRVRHRTGRPPHQDDRVWARPVFADGDESGQVLLVQDGHADELFEAVAGQVAMACSLALMRERAASRARAEAAEQVLWDLLHGPLEHRMAARSRAQQLNVTLTGGLRVLHGHIENIGTLALDQAWGAAKTDRVRRQVLRSVKALQGRELTLASLRGDLVVAVVAGLDPAGAKSLVTALSAAIHDELPDLHVAWGVSRAHDDLMDLPSGLNEARTALAAARRLGGQTVFLYEELGIVRLLLGSGDDPDLQTFVREVTGPLLAYDRDNDGSLIRTLRAFFDADCSQRVASERLFVHHKTLRYRLERIRELTGLNLARHEDRMRADFALRLLQVSRSGEEAGDPGEPAV